MNDVDEVRAFLETGWDPDAKIGPLTRSIEISNWRALCYAAVNGYVEMAELLLDYGAGPDWTYCPKKDEL